jgi:protein-S-isoprenylcysteine O-methyltransferase Ste14
MVALRDFVALSVDARFHAWRACREREWWDIAAGRRPAQELKTMDHSAPSYGLWLLVAINVAVFAMFAFSFFKPTTARDWRSFGAFTAFIVALFVEMYGFPLTIYFMAGWLGQNYPEVDFLSHDAGHLLELLFGWGGDPHWGPFHILSYLFIGGGFWILAEAWPTLYAAQRQGQLAQSGLYAKVRHPQYIGFVLIMFGFLLQWPTILTLLMFPVLLFMYGRLALTEERESAARFGLVWQEYASRVPRFVPRLG